MFDLSYVEILAEWMILRHYMYFRRELFRGQSRVLRDKNTHALRIVVHNFLS